jgi:hypothetical protein
MKHCCAPWKAPSPRRTPATPSANPRAPMAVRSSPDLYACACEAACRSTKARFLVMPRDAYGAIPRGQAIKLTTCSPDTAMNHSHIMFHNIAKLYLLEAYYGDNLQRILISCFSAGDYAMPGRSDTGQRSFGHGYNGHVFCAFRGLCCFAIPKKLSPQINIYVNGCFPPLPRPTRRNCRFPA